MAHGTVSTAAALCAVLLAAALPAAAAAAAAAGQQRGPKLIHDVFECPEYSDGAGAQVHRCVGHEGGKWKALDPFLVFDVYRATTKAALGKGFLAHPHRGFTELRYLHAGTFHHEDSCGGKADTTAGGLQLHRFARGAAHEVLVTPRAAGEPVPTPQAGADWLLAGFQLWLNVPAAEQLLAPGFANWADADFPRYTRTGVRPFNAPPAYFPPPSAVVKVLAGKYGGKTGPVSANLSTALLFLDVERLQVGTPPLELFNPDDGQHTMLYVYKGSVTVGPDAKDPDMVVHEREMAVLGRGHETIITAVKDFVHPSGDNPGGASDVAAFVIVTAPRVRQEVFMGSGFAVASRAALDKAVEELNSGGVSHC
jgi:redox-sensitive bicupin YhaK (pirin superfamily)